MAAAARLNEPDPALGRIRTGLSELQSECQRPSNLEKSIERIRRSDMIALAKAVDDYRGTLLPEAGRAARLRLRDVEIALDAFHDYVQHRADHEADEHVIGRARVATYLLDEIDKAIDHFGGTKLARRSRFATIGAA